MKKIFASEMTGAFHGPDAPHDYSPQWGKYFVWPGPFPMVGTIHGWDISHGWGIFRGWDSPRLECFA
jgi:hypothetical protein